MYIRIYVPRESQCALVSPAFLATVAADRKLVLIPCVGRH